MQFCMLLTIVISFHLCSLLFHTIHISIEKDKEIDGDGAREWSESGGER